MYAIAAPFSMIDATPPESPAETATIRSVSGASGAKSKGGNFVDGRVVDARAGKTIEMACEQVVAPTATDDLAKAV
ncbi:MAG TPA: hypothetical protein PLV92_17040, partial [Pirellulaceae bacterium]|nr:hypothetical protein [Pirellulaceae bacterium]